MTEKLPPGYINLGPISLHIDDVSNRTADIDRFTKYLPLARELLNCDAGTDEARAIFEAADDSAAMLMTVEDLAHLLCALAVTGRLMQMEPVEIH